MSKRIMLAGLLAVSCLGSAPVALAATSGYFVVIPVPDRTTPKQVEVFLSQQTLPSAIAGLPYRGFDFKRLLSVSGDADYTGYGVKWNVISGRLPAGLILGPDGVLSGTPAESGTSEFRVQATYMTKSGARTYQLTTTRLVVALGATATLEALAGQAFSYDLKPLLSVSGDDSYDGSGVSWAVVSNNLPAGLQLLNNGTIAGTPTGAGAGAITAQATYRGFKGQQTYQVVSLAISVSLEAGTPPQARVGETYNYDLKPLLRVSGDSKYAGNGVSWRARTSTLPAGLSLTAAGTITGTPTSATTGSVTVQATYRNVTGEQAYSVTALPAYTYTWQTSNWTAPTACGTVTQTRTVWCGRSDGATVAGTFCSGPAPASSQSATSYAECTYSISYGTWSSCSASCGGGTQSRSATCYRSDGTIVAKSNCGATTTSRSCNTQACAPPPPPTPTGYWSPVTYNGSCSSSPSGSPKSGDCVSGGNYGYVYTSNCASKNPGSPYEGFGQMCWAK